MTAITHPTALADQCQAAERDAAGHLADIARATGAALGQLHTTPWLAAQIRAIYDSLADGDVYVCDHVVNGPCAMLACLWAPGIVVCDQCAPTLLLATSAAADTTCDRCHKAGQEIHSTAIATGPLILAYGLCPACQARADSPARPGRGGPRRRR